MMQTIIVAARDRARLAEIFRIATRFGLGMLLARLGLQNGSGEDGAPDELPRRVRMAIEALGPTFVKLGQILATRSDLLSPEWIAELEQLHAQAPTLEFGQLREAVEAALGEPPETAFAQFDPAPLAAASMAQVHRATLHDGRAVVLKIRRPGIRPRVEADLRLIAHLAAVVERSSAEARRFQPAALVRQLAEAISAELDFTAEGNNADRMRADFARDPRVIVPEIHWAWTSETLLVMDHVEGIIPREAATLRAAGIDPVAIADLGADIVLDMVLINGRFHADPHPGNLLCLPGNRLALLDMGMIGHVSPRRRGEFIDFVQALGAGDAAQLADVLALWAQGSDVPRAHVERAAERLIERHSGGRFVLSAMVADFMALMRTERMTMPPDLLLVFKALVTLDGVLLAIAPDFDLAMSMKRASMRLLQRRLDPDHWLPLLGAIGRELARLGDDAPRLIRAATRRLEAEAAPVPARQATPASAPWIVAAAILIGAGLVSAAIILS